MIDIKYKGVCPEYKSEGAAGADLTYTGDKDIKVRSGKTALIKVDLVLQIPEGYEGQIRPRSGLAMKYGITVLNTPGTIDSDYRGKIGVILYNTSDKLFVVKKHMRIAQLIVKEVEKINFIDENDGQLSFTDRGEGGFGSTDSVEEEDDE